MSREEIAAWRKEQRRERNRQSAAESRNKTKNKIAELEGEAYKYKMLCDAMRIKMEQMEQQIQLLTAAAEQKVEERSLRASSRMDSSTITPPSSYPNSPSRSPVDPHQLPLFPPLLSSPADCVPVQVTSHDIAPIAAVVPLKNEVSSSVESKEHLKPISRQA